MKRQIFLLIVALAVLVASATVADTTLIEFGSRNFDGWIYNRADFEITTSAITQNRIILFTTDAGEYCTLQSPVFPCTGCDSLKIDVTYHITNTAGNTNKVALLVELVDPDSVITASRTIVPDIAQIEQVVTATVPTSDTEAACLLFSAPLADIYNSGAIKKIKVYAVEKNPDTGLLGDINNDNKVDVSDVNLLINALLLNLNTTQTDLNRDNKTDISDLNMIINILLGQE